VQPHQFSKVVYPADLEGRWSHSFEYIQAL